MTDIAKLKEVIEDSGMTMMAIARKSGILRPTLYNRLIGIGDFTASEIMGLCEALHLTKRQREEIFFAKEVSSDSTLATQAN